MMPLWAFATDAESDAFCQEIVARIVRLFGISVEEAIGRINRLWRGIPFLGEDIIYHETPDYWAHVMYYGKASSWWITGEERQRRGLDTLIPQPYP